MVDVMSLVCVVNGTYVDALSNATYVASFVEISTISSPPHTLLLCAVLLDICSFA